VTTDFSHGSTGNLLINFYCIEYPLMPLQLTVVRQNGISLLHNIVRSVSIVLHAHVINILYKLREFLA